MTRLRAGVFLFLLALVCSAGRAQAEEGLPRITTPVLKMTGLATPVFRQPKITTPALKMTGLAIQTFRQPKVTTPSLEMTGLAHDESSSEITERDVAEPRTDKYTFLVPVELENMPDKADRLQVTVTMYSGSQILGSEMAEKNIRGGSFNNTISISVAPTVLLPDKNLTYKASLVICGVDACDSPKVSREGSLASQSEIEVPALSVTGNKKEDEVMQSVSALKTDAEDSFRGGSDRADMNAEMTTNSDPEKSKYSANEASASGALKSI